MQRSSVSLSSGCSSYFLLDIGNHMIKTTWAGLWWSDKENICCVNVSCISHFWKDPFRASRAGKWGCLENSFLEEISSTIIYRKAVLVDDDYGFKDGFFWLHRSYLTKYVRQGQGKTTVTDHNPGSHFIQSLVIKDLKHGCSCLWPTGGTPHPQRRAGTSPGGTPPSLKAKATPLESRTNQPRLWSQLRKGQSWTYCSSSWRNSGEMSLWGGKCGLPNMISKAIDRLQRKMLTAEAQTGCEIQKGQRHEGKGWRVREL